MTHQLPHGKRILRVVQFSHPESRHWERGIPPPPGHPDPSRGIPGWIVRLAPGLLESATPKWQNWALEPALGFPSRKMISQVATW